MPRVKVMRLLQFCWMSTAIEPHMLRKPELENTGGLKHSKSRKSDNVKTLQADTQWTPHSVLLLILTLFKTTDLWKSVWD